MAKRKSPPPDDLTRDEKNKLLAFFRKRIREGRMAHKWGTVEAIQFEVDRCLAWHESKGRECVNWTAACRNWIAKEARDQAERTQGGGFVRKSIETLASELEGRIR